MLDSFHETLLGLSFMRFLPHSPLINKIFYIFYINDIINAESQ